MRIGAKQGSLNISKKLLKRYTSIVSKFIAKKSASEKQEYQEKEKEEYANTLAKIYCKK